MRRSVSGVWTREMYDCFFVKIENNATPNASVYLHTGEYLAPFYKQFGFTPAFSMYKKVKGKNRD
ncbi:MAG: hypothetical protein ACTHLE_16880 [Agriterribacter sp.]